MYNKTQIIGQPGTNEIVMIREFDAPRELVFRSFTNPELFVQWNGPEQYSMTFDRFEPINGGSWRYVFRDGNGRELAFHGVYHEVKEPERIINTFEFEGNSGFVTLEKMTFEQLEPKKTKIVAQSLFQSIEARERELQILKTSIDIYERLEKLLKKWQN